MVQWWPIGVFQLKSKSCLSKNLLSVLFLIVLINIAAGHQQCLWTDSMAAQGTPDCVARPAWVPKPDDLVYGHKRVLAIDGGGIRGIIVGERQNLLGALSPMLS
jgi:hypothetical protein